MSYNKYTKKGDIHWQWYLGGNVGYKCLVDESVKYFPKSGTVLDVGCGDGLPSYLLALKGLSVVGIEPEPDGLSIAKERLQNLDFVSVCSTVEDFSKNIEVDYLYSLNTIEHVQDPSAFVELMKNVKKFGIVVTDNIENSKGHAHHNIEFSIESLEELFKDFKTERIHFSDPWTEEHFIGLKICSV